MIKRLQYSEIDFTKYNNCLENSVQRKYSATKEFLDITSGKQWELLVYKDYEAVMPVAYGKKFKLKFVHNPKLCQQLGIFSAKDSKELNDAFFSFLKKNYLVQYYGFNDKNEFSSSLKKRKNFLINPDEYEKVYQKYSPKRKRKIRQEPEIKQNSEIRKNLRLDEVENFIKGNMRGADSSPNDIADFLKILQDFYEKNLLILNGYYYHGRLINLIAVYEEEKTLALLGTYNDHEYVKISGASVLIDEILKEKISEKIFDFEGGDIPNIEEFFRGFRPEQLPYPSYRNSKKAIIRKLLRLNFL